MSANNKFLGIAAIAASPFLGLEMSTNGSENTSWGAFFGLIYMLGWMCGVIALMQMKAAGEKLTGRIVLFIQLLLLCISNIWNVWAIIDPANSSTLFFMIGFFWPLSHLFMLVTGISVMVAGKIKGWRRWMPLLAGLWLPVSALILMFVFNNARAMNLSITYSVLAGSLLGLAIATSNQQTEIISSRRERTKAIFKPQLVS